jgi:hypothetical protein
MPNLKLTGDKLSAAMLTRKSLPGLAKDLDIPEDKVNEMVREIPGRGGSRDYIVVDRSQDPIYWITMPGEVFHHYYAWDLGPDGRALAKVVAK